MCFEHDGYNEFYNQKTVTTKKPHKCECCRETIPSGAKCDYHAGKFDGDFFAFYVCESCERKRLSIAADEIRHGCDYSTAWASYEDINDYLAECPDLEILDGTLEECRRQVNEIWKKQLEETK
jgi:hypothetical protein